MADHPHFNGNPILIGDKVTFRDDDEQYTGRVIQILSRDPVLNVSYKLKAPSGKIGLTSTSVFVDEVISHDPATFHDEPDETAAMAYRRGLLAAYKALQDTPLPHAGGASRSNTRQADLRAIEDKMHQEPPGDIQLTPEYRERERYRQGLEKATQVIRQVDVSPDDIAVNGAGVRDTILGAVIRESREVDAIELPDLSTPMEKAEVRGYLRGLQMARDAVKQTSAPPGNAVASWESARHRCFNTVEGMLQIATGKLQQSYPMSDILA